MSSCKATNAKAPGWIDEILALAGAVGAGPETLDAVLAGIANEAQQRASDDIIEDASGTRRNRRFVVCKTIFQGLSLEKRIEAERMGGKTR